MIRICFRMSTERWIAILKDIKGESFINRSNNLQNVLLMYPRYSVFCTRVRTYPRNIFVTEVVYTNAHFSNGKLPVTHIVPNNLRFISWCEDIWCESAVCAPTRSTTFPVFYISLTGLHDVFLFFY